MKTTRHIIAAVLVGGVLAAGGWAFVRHASGHWERARATWAGRLVAMANDRARALDLWLGDGLGDAGSIASYPTVRFVLGGAGPRTFPAQEGARPHLDDLLREAGSRQGYVAVAVLDADLEPVSVQGDPPPGFAEEAGRAARRVALEGGAVVDVLGSPSTPMHVLFAAAVHADEGTGFRGAVVLAADPETFLVPILRGEPVPTASAEVMLARREGDDAVFLTAGRFHAGGPLSLRRPLDEPDFAMRHALAGVETFGDFLDYRGVAVLASTRRLERAPWGLVAKVDRAEAHAAERAHLVQEGAVLLALLAGAAGLAFGLWHQRGAALAAELQRSSARAAALLDHANDAILFVGPDGRIQDSNRRAAELYGVPREILVGRSVLDLHTDEDRQEGGPALDELLREGSAVFEARHRDAKGSPLPVEVSSRLVDLGDGTVVVSIVRDIRDRKAHEARIHTLTRLYQTLSEVNQLIVRGEPDRQRLFEGVCRILTRSGGFPLALVGEKAADGSVRMAALDGPAAAYVRGLEVRWDDTPLGRGPGGQALREGRPVVVAGLAADPTFAPWAGRARALGLETVGVFPVLVEGEAVAFLAIYGSEAHAISEEQRRLLAGLADDVGFALAGHQARQDRERTQAALHAFFRSDVVGIFFGDVDGRVLDANDALLRIIGYSREELERGEVRWTDITPPEHLPRDDAAIAEARERGACTPYEKQYIRKDGRRIWVLVGFTLLEPERERSVAFIHDITATREAEEQIRRLTGELDGRVRERTAALEAANADLEAFSYSVSHDLRAPLRAIDGFSRILEEEHAGGLDEEGRRLLGMLRDNAATMSRLIHDLLAFSRAGHQELKRRSVDMGALAREAFEELAESHDIEGLELRIGSLEAAEGDPALLKQVWLNLLSNALEFTRGRRPRVIEVRSTAEGGGVRYAVRDTGEGFEPEHADRVFQVFQRLHPAGEHPGSGIGLALVQRIVTRHGGRVGAEGRPGEGATFWFVLPSPWA